jgi:phycoerythrobilin:ferredoxin oxidoreductase
MEFMEGCQSVQPIEIPSLMREREGLIGKNSFTLKINAYQTEKIRYARTVVFTGKGFNVYNLVLLPRQEYSNLPILGVDVVYVANKQIVAIDFQPQSELATYFQSSPYSNNQNLFAKWRAIINQGQEVPENARRFFSPYAIWTSEPLSSDSHNERTQLYEDCLKQVLQAYCEIIRTVDPIAVIPERCRFQREYLRYRTENDPAKNILNKVFGDAWTIDVLSNYMFPEDV